MPTRNINLTEHSDRYVASQIASGRFSNASEFGREALRLLEEHEQERDFPKKTGCLTSPVPHRSV
jgi:putative addiction module CopG family antidote